MAETTRVVAGWPSFPIENDEIEAWVTEEGGHLAPVFFDRGQRRFQPFYIAPWAEEKWPDQPKLLQVLRGDFFCLPFGGNDAAYRGEKHPVHGETANERWTPVGRIETDQEKRLELELKTTVRPGTVRKVIRLVTGHQVVYCRHLLTGYQGRMCLGHHAILRFPDQPGSGLFSCSRFLFGQVAAGPVEDPAAGGYSILKPGARFSRLTRVPLVTGEMTDLSRYPARAGYEDIVSLVSNPSLPFAWSAVSFPEEGYLWFGLKNPRQLACTLLWMSNGGRHYPPWNGRNRNTMGVEEVTSYFHYGLKESASPNPFSREGIKTYLSLSPRSSTIISYLMGCVAMPPKFGAVKEIRPDREGKTALIIGEGARVETPLDWNWILSA
ncbi:MAG TPA: hypothetical protein PKX93_04205 [bacterium]|nr:hypothetical protein [bacterium]